MQQHAKQDKSSYSTLISKACIMASTFSEKTNNSTDLQLEYLASYSKDINQVLPTGNDVDKQKCIELSQVIRSYFFNSNEKAYMKNVSDIVVIGEQSAGKSTMCNSLIRQLILPMKNAICTRVRCRVDCTYDKSIENIKCTLTKHINGKQQTVLEKADPNIVFKKFGEINESYNENEFPNDIYQISLLSNVPTFGMAIIDNPGINVTSRDATLILSQNSIGKYLEPEDSLASLVICSTLTRAPEDHVGTLINYEKVKCEIFFVFTKVDIELESNKSKLFRNFKETSEYKSNPEKEHSIVNILISWGNQTLLKYKLQKSNVTFSFIASNSEDFITNREKFDMTTYMKQFDKSEEDNNNTMMRKLNAIMKEGEVEGVKIYNEDLTNRPEFGIKSLFNRLLYSTYDSVIKSVEKFQEDLETNTKKLKENIDTNQKELENLRTETGRTLISFVEEFSNCYSCFLGGASKNDDSINITNIIEKENGGYSFDEEEELFPAPAPYVKSPIQNKNRFEAKVYYVSQLVQRFKYHYSTRTMSIRPKEVTKELLMKIEPNNAGRLDPTMCITKLARDEYKEIKEHNNKFASSRLGAYYTMCAQEIYNAFKYNNYSMLIDDKDKVILNYIKDVRMPVVEKKCYYKYDERSTSTISDIIQVYELKKRKIKVDIAKSITSYSYEYNRLSVEKQLMNQWNPLLGDKTDSFDILILEFASAFIHNNTKYYNDTNVRKLYGMINANIMKLNSKNANKDSDQSYESPELDKYESANDGASSSDNATLKYGNQFQKNSDSYSRHAQKNDDTKDKNRHTRQKKLPSASESIGSAIEDALKQFCETDSVQESINGHSLAIFNIHNLIENTDIGRALVWYDKPHDSEINYCNHVYKRMRTTSLLSMISSTLGVVNSYTSPGRHGVGVIEYEIMSRITSLLLGYEYPYSAYERPNDYNNPMKIIPFIHAYKLCFTGYDASRVILSSDLEYSESPLFKVLSNISFESNDVVHKIDTLYERWKTIVNNIDNGGQKLNRAFLSLDEEIIQILAHPCYHDESQSVENLKYISKSIDYINIYEECKIKIEKLVNYMKKNKEELLSLHTTSTTANKEELSLLDEHLPREELPSLHESLPVIGTLSRNYGNEKESTSQYWNERNMEIAQPID